MRCALELCGITKRFTAGFGTCLASTDALRGLDLVVYEGECVALTGQAATGKSTALLCAAGLLIPDAGSVRWFGKASRATAIERTTYHVAVIGQAIARIPRPELPHLHLLDAPEQILPGPTDKFIRWIERHRSRGDAILLATRDVSLADRVADRTVSLVSGRSYAAAPTRVARVAEGGARLVSRGGTM